MPKERDTNMTSKCELTNRCIFNWKIENFSHCCWLGEEVVLVSPTFITDKRYGTKWALHLHPNGDKFEDSIALYLFRRADNGSLEIEVEYQLTFLNKDGLVLKRLNERSSLKRGESGGSRNFESRKRVFFTEKNAFLPQGALTVQCVIQEINDGVTFKTNYVRARTVFKVNRRFVLWKINRFSMMKSIMRNKFKDNSVELDLILKKNMLKLDVIAYKGTVDYISVGITIRKKRNYGDGEFNGSKMHWSFFTGREEEGEFGNKYYITHLPLKKLIKNRSKYMPIDVLSLEIEYVYLTLTHTFDGLSSGKPQEKSQSARVLIDDLESMYTYGIFYDAILCTSLQSFPVHRGILSARSPVFTRMFNNNMMEKNNGIVNITDLEDDTVHRMLLFMYTDLLKDLPFESAFKLYVAADKYEILSLKSRCSSFLKDNLCPSRACDVLILADSHQDKDLISFVQGYILEHDDVFNLKEWKDLMETNLKLAADIMFKKILPSNV